MENDKKTVYEVPLTTAKVWVSTYLAGKPVNTVRSFLIDADELQDIINEHGAAYVRVYFGINPLAQEHPEKLLLVPVDELGKDMIPTGGKEENSNIFDFTMPCPPTCDYDSPLYQPITNK